MAEDPDLIARLANPALESSELEAELSRTWREQLADPEAAARLAAILKVEPAKLQSLADAPLEFNSDGSGLATTDIVVTVATWAFSEVVLKALADLGKEAVKKALQEAWDRVLKPAMLRHQRRPGALGD